MAVVRLRDLLDGKLRCPDCDTRIDDSTASIAFSFKQAPIGCFKCHKFKKFDLNQSDFPGVAKELQE